MGYATGSVYQSGRAAVTSGKIKNPYPENISFELGNDSAKLDSIFEAELSLISVEPDEENVRQQVIQLIKTHADDSGSLAEALTGKYESLSGFKISFAPEGLEHFLYQCGIED